MRENRRAARKRLREMSTVQELRNHIESLNISEQEKEIALMFYEKGWTCSKIALETDYSLRQVTRKLAKIADKM